MDPGGVNAPLFPTAPPPTLALVLSLATTVEQNANMALSIADRGYVLQTGRIVLADTAQNLLQNEMMKKAYLGA